MGVLSSVKKCMSLLCLTIVSAAVILAVLPTASATEGETKISVVPAVNVFNTVDYPVNTTFNLTVTVTNVTDLWNWQVNFTFDPTLLHCTNAILQFPFNFTIPGVSIDNTAGYALFGASKLGAEPGVNGSGVLAIVTLNITTAPSDAYASCNLTLHDRGIEGSALKNSTMGDIPTIMEHGYYYYGKPVIHGINYNAQTYNVSALNFTLDPTKGNATITPVPMLFDQPQKRLAFNVSGTFNNTGYVFVTIPYNLMHNDWNVTVDGQQVTCTNSSVGTKTSLLFMFNMTGTNQLVYVSASWVVPEFQPATMILILMITTLATIAISKGRFKKLNKKFRCA